MFRLEAIYNIQLILELDVFKILLENYEWN